MAGVILFVAIKNSKPDPAIQAAKDAKKEAEQAENKRKGIHCLEWDGSHFEVRKYVKKQMREPDSFEHIETRVVPVNEKGQHTLTMKYRARNGFGGMSVGSALATFNNSDCAATVLAVE
jgi:hypothetical protein